MQIEKMLQEILFPPNIKLEHYCVSVCFVGDQVYTHGQEFFDCVPKKCFNKVVIEIPPAGE